jgi:hypothetical protein
LTEGFRDLNHPAAAAPKPPLEVKHLGPRVEPEPQQKVRREHRDMMAGGAIDLDEIATSEILVTCQRQGLHSGLRSRNVLRALAGLVNGHRVGVLE